MSVQPATADRGPTPDDEPSDVRATATTRVTQAARPGRLRMLVRVLALGTVAGLLLVLLFPFAALELVETDLARSSLRDWARERGIELDYAQLTVRPFSGRLALRGLRVATPEPLAHAAPELLSLRSLEVRFSPSALTEGRLHVERVELEGLRAYLVTREDTDSITLLIAGLVSSEPEPEEPSAPLSHLLAELELPMQLRVDALSARDVRVEHTDLLAEGQRRSISVDGAELVGWLRQDRGPLEAELTLASPSRGEGTRVAWVEHDGDAAHAREVDLALSLRATLPDPSTVALALRVELLRQTFDEELELPRDALSASLAARFDPARELVALTLSELSLLEGAARLTLGAELLDGAAIPRLTEGDGTVALDALVAYLPPELGVFSQQARLELRARPAAEGASRVEVRGRADRLGASGPLARVELEDLALELDVTMASEQVSASLRLPVPAVRASSPAGAIELDELLLVVDPIALSTADGSALEWDALLSAIGRAEAVLTAEAARARSDDVPSLETGALRIEARVPLSGRPSFSPELTLALGETRLALADGTRARVAPLRGQVSATELSADFAQPARVRAELTLPRAELTGAERLSAEGLSISLDGTLRGPSALDAQLRARAGALSRVERDAALSVRGAEVRVSVRDAVLDPEDLARSRAMVALDTRTERIELRDELGRVLLEGLAPTLRGSYRGAGRSGFTGTVPLGALRTAEADGALETLLPQGELTFSVSDLVVNPEQPLRSRMTLTARGNLPHTTLEIAARLADGAGDGTLHAHVAPLSALAPGAVPEGLDLTHAALDVRARGRWSGLAGRAPVLDHHVEVSLTRTEYEQPGLTLELPRVGLTLDHHGRGDDHRVTARVVLDPPRIDGQRLEQAIVLTTEASLDVGRWAGHLESVVGGPGELAIRLRADAALDAEGTLRHTERLTLSGLGPLAGLIPTGVRDEHPIALDPLILSLEGSGNLTRIPGADLSRMAEWDGTLQQNLALTLTGVRYTPEGTSVVVPEVRLSAEVQETPDALSVEASLELPRLDLEDPSAHYTLLGTRQNVHVRSQGPLSEGRLVVEMDGTIERVEQDLLAAYPMEDLSLTARFRMDGFESMELRRFTLVNARGGTRLELSKTLDRVRAAVDDTERGRGSQHLVLRGELHQELSRLDAAPELLRARGRLEAPFTVTSADGSLFRIAATLELHEVGVELPELGVVLQGVEARFPLEEALEWTPETGLAIVPHTERNPFARVRFQDVQPFLRDESHLEIESARWVDVELGHLVGSLRVDRNVFALNGVRIERGDALITGQLLVDYLPGEERVHFRGNVTGLRPHGTDEPLDANAALVFDPNRLEVDGRVQIVRIAGSHLLELLDMIDPYRENGSLNAVRSALDWGHPQRVTLALSRGLMSMNVRLGGILGSLIQIGEIRGIALGPFMSRHVAPYLVTE